MKKFYAYLALCLSILFVSVAVAQDLAPTPPPKMIQIYREEMKSGKAGAHQRTEAAFVRTAAKFNGTSHYVALTTLTGPEEAWFITRYDSYAEFGKDQAFEDAHPAMRAELNADDEADGALRNSSRSIFATYRADLSYRPGVNIPSQHFDSITIVRVRPGHVTDFEAARKIIKDAHEKTALKFNYSVYQVNSGMPAGTFLIITPYKTLADIDAAGDIHGQAYRDAVGDDGRRKLNELSNSGTISSETMIFAVDPKMSYPAKDWIASDPGFWNPKPAMSSAPAKKPAAKAPTGN
jgi:hypothetical protein